MIAPITPDTQDPVKTPHRRRRRSHGNGEPCGGANVGQVIDCENTPTAGIIVRFLRSLSPKERGFALRMLLRGLQAARIGGAE